jgi:hypothetical protein
VSKFDQLRALVDTLTTPEALAEEFCKLDDDTQAKFFVHVAQIMSTWPPTAYLGPAAPAQAMFIGRHLATCECSTEQARALIRNIAEAMDNAADEPKEAA